MSNRQIDTRGEKVLGLFLDEFFYPTFCNSKGIGKFERIYSAKEQIEGCDLLFTNQNGASFRIDEKTQLHYINQPRKTFAFELSYFSEKTGKIVDGWFINKNNRTDFYMLIWINESRKAEINRLVEDDIQRIQVMILKKKQIMTFLSSCGWPIDRLMEKANSLRNHDKEGAIKLTEEMFLYYSRDRYVEKPINLVVQRNALEKIAYGTYEVTRQQVKSISFQ